MSTIDGIAIPDDIQWTDEFTSWKVGQVFRTSLNGALIVHESSLQAGRPITLESGQDASGFYGVVTLDVLRALQASEEAGDDQPFDVVLPDHNSGTRTFSCVWRRDSSEAITARAKRFVAPYADDDYFAVTLRLIQVD